MKVKIKLKKTYFVKIIVLVLYLLFICEYLIYYIVLIQCSWPELNKNQEDPAVPVGDGKEVRVLLLADTHLLGSRNGHWFDKLRREWQMYRTFQTALFLHSPNLVFILGDIFDEGLWCSDAEFITYVQRFSSMFYVPADTKLYTVVGNHDIGFHYGISPYLQERFSRAFNASSVRLLSISGNHFVLINSMAMEGDGCFLCRPAELQINKIIARLRCTKGIGKCPKGFYLKQYSRPILLQHFPLYRESDATCNEPDEAPEDEKKQKFRERWECLSKEATEMLLDGLKPRVVMTGHTHHGCHQYHMASSTHEYTLPSFSWRNKDNPSYVLAVFSPNNYAVSKCYMPRESTVEVIYIVGISLIIIYLVFNHPKFCRRTRIFKTN